VLQKVSFDDRHHDNSRPAFAVLDDGLSCYPRHNGEKREYDVYNNATFGKVPRYDSNRITSANESHRESAVKQGQKSFSSPQVYSQCQSL
jgi:hypothetical protein